LDESLKAAAELEAAGINICVIDLFTIKPLDTSTLIFSARKTGGRILVVEDHYPEGALLVQCLFINFMCLTFFKAAGSFYRNDALHLKTLCIGPSIYDVHEKIGFLTPLPVHMSQTPPCGRPHAVDMKYTSLS